MEQKQQALHTHVQHLAAQGERQIAVAGLVTNVDAFCERIQYGLATATFEQKRALVELLVDRVVVTDEQVEIRYVIPMSPTSEQVRFCHLRTDYFGAPHLIRAFDDTIPQEIRIDPMPWCARCWTFPHHNALHAHLPHQAPHPLAIDHLPLRAQRYGHVWPAVEGCRQVVCIDLPY